MVDHNALGLVSWSVIMYLGKLPVLVACEGSIDLFVVS